MAPRAYDTTTRELQQAELKARIAAAAAELHRTQGALATSWADIAREAGVSLPTVYKHFPTMDDLLQACTGHVAAQAPQFAAEAIVAAPDLEAAARALVEAVEMQHHHFAPWRAWREHGQLPALARMYEQQRVQLTGLCQQVLARHGVDDARSVAAVWEALLHFELWHRLVHAHGMARAAARERIVHLLLAAAGPRPAAPTPARPKPRKT
ncbi:TetR/AcrR family transcriptional regulator [Ramlibacter albus]|uniref:TetR/AcrR family transcriptional regulator n=1 Tax=Ramlibacter albus TaxID=2079448 RepID=A0A923M6D2_9BURK|nr:TetR/AcrR family transcriptional regulator [Ramlibacter albus]MBC5763738.1 TetR/AcrR family transcriptional regulator [Ramlibacter albus]